LKASSQKKLGELKERCGGACLPSTEGSRRLGSFGGDTLIESFEKFLPKVSLDDAMISVCSSITDNTIFDTVASGIKTLRDLGGEVGEFVGGLTLGVSVSVDVGSSAEPTSESIALEVGFALGFDDSGSISNKGCYISGSSSEGVPLGQIPTKVPGQLSIVLSLYTDYDKIAGRSRTLNAGILAATMGVVLSDDVLLSEAAECVDEEGAKKTPQCLFLMREMIGATVSLTVPTTEKASISVTSDYAFLVDVPFEITTTPESLGPSFDFPTSFDFDFGPSPTPSHHGLPFPR